MTLELPQSQREAALFLFIKWYLSYYLAIYTYNKTSDIKILPEAHAILDLYDRGKAMPDVISDQKFNDALIMKTV